MYNIWLLIVLILIVIILFIIIRRFPSLAILDVDNIPKEKEAKIKEEISRKRIKRKFSFFSKHFASFVDFVNKIFDSFWFKLKKIKEEKEQERENARLFKISPKDKIDILFSQADDLIKNEKWDEAEKKLLDVISIDDKNFKAFLNLANVYQSQEKWEEAKQTLLYTLKLSEISDEENNNDNLANLNYSLALINKKLNDLDSSFENISEALKINFNNPRYLDLMLDLCIIKKKKELANNFLSKIKKINPENNNISEWEEKIASL
jgi:tetratricopeptide (TPR) repeat protein